LRTISQRNRADVIAILPKAVPAHSMALAHFRQPNVYETTIRSSLPYVVTATFADAAGWVLIAVPRDRDGDYIRNVPVNGSRTQVAAFDNAAQCEEQRIVKINS